MDIAATFAEDVRRIREMRLRFAELPGARKAALLGLMALLFGAGSLLGSWLAYERGMRGLAVVYRQELAAGGFADAAVRGLRRDSVTPSLKEYVARHMSAPETKGRLSKKAAIYGTAWAVAGALPFGAAGAWLLVAFGIAPRRRMWVYALAPLASLALIAAATSCLGPVPGS